MHPWSAAVMQISAAPSSGVGPVTTPTLLRSSQAADALTWTGIRTSPVDLHRLSAISSNLYATARTVSSESVAVAEAQLATAECVRNEAAARKVEEYQLLAFGTISAYNWTQGKYGEGHGRFASTRLDPTRRTLTAANAALTASTNIANGARHWFAPRVQDSGHQGARDLANDAHAIVDKWGRRGWRWIGALPNVDSYRTVFFRLATGKQSNDDLHAVIELGRAGKPTVGRESPDPTIAQVAATGSPAWILAAVVAAGLIVL